MEDIVNSFGKLNTSSRLELLSMLMQKNSDILTSGSQNQPISQPPSSNQDIGTNAIGPQLQSDNPPQAVPDPQTEEKKSSSTTRSKYTDAVKKEAV